MRNPIRKRYPSTLSEDPVRLRQRLFEIRHVTESFLADDSVHASIREGHVHYAAVENASGVFKTNTLCKLRRPSDSRRSKLNSRHVCTISVRQVTHGATKASTKICYPGAFANERSASQFVSRLETAVVILIVREQVFRTQPIEMAPACI